MVASPGSIGSRRGFTMIELLVVILIIGVLVGLLLPAISGVRSKADVATAQHDISQIGIGIENWKSSNTSKWLIDNIIMIGGNDTNGVPNMISPMTAAANRDQAGFEWLKRTWPRLEVNNIPGTTALPVKLDTGGKCLAYFLMGPNGQGLNKSSTNPLVDGGAGQTNNPYMEFPAKRVTANGLLDPWDMPYVYFVSRGTNGYQGSAGWVNPDNESGTVYPYVEPGVYTGRLKYANQNTYQIISGGPDRRFGTGGVDANTPMAGQSTSKWKPETLGSGYSETEFGFDDISNFNGAKQLGVK